MEEALFISASEQTERESLQTLREKLADVCRITVATPRQALALESFPAISFLPYREDCADSREYSALAEAVTKDFSKKNALEKRFYVYPSGISATRFNELKKAGTSLTELGDVLQISDDGDLDRLVGDVRSYLDNRGREKAAAKRFGFVRYLDLCVGTAALVLTVLCYVVSLCICFLSSISGNVLPWLRFDSVFALCMGVPVINLIGILIYLFRGGIQSYSREYDRIVSAITDFLLVAAAILVTAVSVALIVSEKTPLHWIAVSVVAALVLDVLRRRRVKGLRYLRFKQVDKSMSTGVSGHIKAAAQKSGRHPVLKALRLPLFRRSRLKLFISYTHSSEWASEIVDEIYDYALEAGLECFLDRNDIRRGSSWRRTIYTRLIDADCFISIADEKSIRKPWPAAEVETALALRALSAAPEMAMIVPDYFTIPPQQERQVMPVFRLAYSCRTEPDFFLRVIRFSRCSLALLIKRGFAAMEGGGLSALFSRPLDSARALGGRPYEKEWENANLALRKVLAKGHKSRISNRSLPDFFGRYALFPEMQSLTAQYKALADAVYSGAMPQTIYRVFRDLAQVCAMAGNARDMTRALSTARDALYGSLLTNYLGMIELHRIEAYLAFGYDKMGIGVLSRNYAALCVSGLQQFVELQRNVLDGFNRDDPRRGLSRYLNTALPLNYKARCSRGFEDILKIAEPYL